MNLNRRINRINGRAVPVPGNDIDTDRIMPARYLVCVTFEHLGKHCFHDERFDPDGKPKDHPFNDLRFRGASVMVVNKNFGCGSSREHAPQGILRSGIRAIIGESFGEIFAGNCVAIGLPAVTASKGDVKKLMTLLQRNTKGEVKVDLEKRQASVGKVSFQVDLRESARTMFLEGTWDSLPTLLDAQDQVRRKAKDIRYLKWADGGEGPSRKAVRSEFRRRGR